MATEMSWSSPAVNGALSAGLAATGFASFFAGRVIDAYGGRALMTAGSVTAALLLLAWSQVTELWQLYAVWIAMGATFSCVLYEPVFAVMARELKDDYRRGIVTITLLGGLASTAFIPLTQFLVDISDWRQALVVLAAIQIPFGILIHWFVLGSTSGTVAVMKATVPAGRVRKAIVTPVFWLLALSYGAHAFMFTGLTFHIIPLLTERGFALPMIIAAYTLVGPFQVIGRIVVFALEKRIDVRFAGLDGNVTAGCRPCAVDAGHAGFGADLFLCHLLWCGHGYQNHRAGDGRTGIFRSRRIRRFAGDFRGNKLRDTGCDTFRPGSAVVRDGRL